MDSILICKVSNPDNYITISPDSWYDILPSVGQLPSIGYGMGQAEPPHSTIGVLQVSEVHVDHPVAVALQDGAYLLMVFPAHTAHATHRLGNKKRPQRAAFDRFSMTAYSAPGSAQSL